jgi:hypothetical protein
MAFDQPMMLPATSPPTAASCDQSLLQSHHEQAQQQCRRSQSHEDGWQRFMEEFEAQPGNLPVDFDILSPQQATRPNGFPTQQQSPPMQSIETAALTTCEAEPQLSATSSGSSSFSYMAPEDQYGLWPTPTSAPPSAFPPCIPESDEWVDYNQHQAMLANNYAMDGSAIGPLQYPPPPQPHHLVGGPSPMLSQGSPFHDDFLDEGWGVPQPDMQPFLPDSSGSDELNDADAADPCYAQLLYRCLKEAPDHTMSLRELYDWVREHSQKAKDPKQRGWQNSVRHNLSMNAVCVPIPVNVFVSEICAVC